MHRAAEAIDLHERRLLAVERDELLTVEERAGGLGDLLEKLEIPALHFRGVALVEDLDQAGAGAGAVDRRRHHEEVGGVVRRGAAVGGREPGPWRHDQARGVAHQRPHKLAVGRLGVLILGDAGVLDPLPCHRLHAALIAHEPHDPAHGPHRLDRLGEQGREKLRLFHVALGERADLVDDREDLPPRLLDRPFVDRAHA